MSTGRKLPVESSGADRINSRYDDRCYRALLANRSRHAYRCLYYCTRSWRRQEGAHHHLKSDYAQQSYGHYFVAADVCKALELDKTWNALQRLGEDEKGTTSISTPGGHQEMSIVNEPGLYSLVLGSRKPEEGVHRRCQKRVSKCQVR